MDYINGSFIALKSLIRTFTVYDFLDIVIVAVLIYHLTKIIRESRAGQLVKGIIIILIGYFLIFILVRLFFNSLNSNLHYY